MSYPEVDFQVDKYGRKIAPNVSISKDVHLGMNVTIYPNVRIEAGATIMDNAVVGRPPFANKTINRKVESTFAEETLIGENTIIGTGAIIYTGCQLEKNILIGDLSSIREYCQIEEGVIIGRGGLLLDHIHIKKFTRIHDNNHLLSHMLIEEHVFFGAAVAIANDNGIFLSRFGLGDLDLATPTIRKYAVVGSGVTLAPGVELGEGCMIGVGACVTKDVPPWTIMIGNPARPLREVPDEWRQKVLDKFEGGNN